MIDFGTRRLDIDALRALRAIRLQGGVTRAAQALGLTQSAVSHKIKRLEVSLDCDLLSRKAGTAMFTAAGEELLEYASRILELHDEALVSLTKTDLAGRMPAHQLLHGRDMPGRLAANEIAPEHAANIAAL